MLEYATIAILVLVFNLFLGCLVGALHDRDGNLLAWYKEAPSPLLQFLFLQLWPVWATVAWIKR